MRFASHSKSELHVSRLNGATGFMASVPHISGDVLEHAQTEQQILWQGKYAAIEAPSRCKPALTEKHHPRRRHVFKFQSICIC